MKIGYMGPKDVITVVTAFVILGIVMTLYFGQ